MNIILINGPAYSGKDTIAKYFYRRHRHGVQAISNYHNAIFERFSQPLKASFAAITKSPMNEFFEVDYYEQHKEAVISWLGVSYRQYQIDLSEKFFKPLYGKRVFGHLFVERIKTYHPDSVVVVPDAGFDIENEVLTEFAQDPNNLLNINNILLCRIHREGYDFTGDSRNYVYSDRLFSLDIRNNTDQSFFEQKTFDIIQAFCKPGHGDLKKGAWL